MRESSPSASASTKAGLPIRHRVPSTCPSIPRPATSCASLEVTVGSAYSLKASASGCCEFDSSAAAIERACAGSRSLVVSVEIRRGRPSVRVPVLSSMTVSTLARPSIASGRMTSTPSLARRELAAANATGVAIESAHGQVATSTARTAGKARAGSITYQASPTKVVSSRIRTMNHEAIRSAARPKRGRSLCARSSNRTRPCKVDSAGRWVTSSVIAAPALIEPPSRGSPWARRLGSDSPVTSDSSTSAALLNTLPSTGMI